MSRILTSRAKDRCWKPSSSRKTSTVACKLLTLFEAIGADAKLRTIVEAGFHQFDFIAGAAAALVAAAENGDALPFREKMFCKPNDHGRFAGAADGEIADADDRAIQALLLEDAFAIESGAPVAWHAVERQRAARGASRTSGGRVIGEAPPNCLATSARARSSAPRLLSTSCFAVSPMRFIFSGSLSR